MKYTLLFLTIVLFGCQKQETKNPFVIEIDDKRVELILENNADYLVYDTPTKATLIWENIDLETSIFAGNGIRKLDFRNNETLIRINYSSKNSSDTLEIQLKFKGINDTEYSNGTIKVPVKK